MTLTRPHSEAATIEHAEQLSKNLSFLDRREIEVYNPLNTPYNALKTGVERSRDAQAFIGRNGACKAMYGVIEAVSREGVHFGMPWLLCADSVEFDTVETVRLVKACKKAIERWHEWYRRLEGFSWAKAVEHHKMLRLLGFELSNPVDRNDVGEELAAPTILFCRHLDYIEKGDPYYV